MPLRNDRILLPNELVLQILLFLGQNDCRHVAQVSRQLRELFIDHPKHFFTCKLIADLGKSEDLENRVTRFVTKLREMTASGQQIVPEVTVYFNERSGSEPDLDCWGIALQAMSEAFIAGAKIVGISFELHRILWTNQLEAMMMGNPAPWLRRLTLTALPRDSEEYLIELPAGIFHNTAPRLHEVSLQNVHVGQPGDDVEAFRDVSTVTLFAPKTQDILRIEEKFLNAREIYLANLDFFHLVGLTAGTTYDLSNCQTPPFGPPRKGPVGVPPRSTCQM